MTTAEAIRQTLESCNESDRNLECANVVDGLFFIGRAIYELAEVMKTRQDSVANAPDQKGNPDGQE